MDLCTMMFEVMNMDKILEQALLYDFYGELLTEHQKDIYTQVVLEDMSLGEVAEEAGISRQGVHDLIKRCTKILEGYEQKLHLVERFVKIRSQMGEISELLDKLPEGHDPEIVQEVRRISQEILEEL